MNAITRLVPDTGILLPPPGASLEIAVAFDNFVRTDRVYDQVADGDGDTYCILWDEALDAVAVKPARSIADCAAKAMVLVASIVREIPRDETEDDLPPQLTLALRLARDVIALGGSSQA